MTSLAEIQAKLLAKANKGGDEKRNRSSGDNAAFPFWETPENGTSTLRFLPDKDPNNTFFWVERQTIKLPFAGVVGQDDMPCEVVVPCVDMFGEKCPITEAIRPWWKDDSKKEMARTYYKKKSYLFQGFVVNSGFVEENVPENPIRRFIVNPSIYELIEKSLMDPEMDCMPIDYDSGRDFKLMKIKKGDYANYTTSTWSFKSRALSDAERAAIDTYGLFNLSDFLGNRPDKDGVAMIKAMFEDSLAGNPFDSAAYGHVYRPSGRRNFNAPAGGSSAPVAAAPAVTVAPTAAKSSAADILARLKKGQ